MQASVAALLAVHILARQRLDWLELTVPDIPTAILGETLGPGDDIRVEIEGAPEVLEVQSKKGLKKDKILQDTFRLIAEKLPQLPHMRVIIAVDSVSTSRSVRDDLKRDLVRMGDGRTDNFTEIAEYVREVVSAAGAPLSVLERVGIRTVDVAHNGEGNAILAIQSLRMILEDSSSAEAAWALLVRECGLLCRDQRRLSFDKLAALLSRNGFPLQKARLVSGSTRPSLPDQPSMVPPKTDLIADAGLSTKSTDPKVTRVQGLLEVSKELLEKGSNAAALELLKEVERSNKRTKLPPELRASLYSRMGAAFMRLGNWKEARRALGRALQHDTKHLGALNNLALVEVYESNDAAALVLVNKAIALKPTSASSWAIRTAVASRLNVPNHPPATLLDDPDYLIGVSNNAMAEGNWSVAAAYAQRALRLLRTVDTLMLYGISRFNASYDGRLEEVAPTGERREVLEEVIAVATEVIGALGKETQSAKLVDAYVLRGSARRSLRDHAGAATDLTRALELDGRHSEAAYQLAIVRMKQDDWPGVLEAAGMVAGGETGGRGRLLVMKARALLLLKREAEVSAVLTEALEASRGTSHEAEVRVNGADVAIAAGLVSVARAFLAGITEAKDQWILHLWNARIAQREGLPSVAEDEFARAISAAAPGDRRVATAEFAMHLARRQESVRAILLFQEVSVEDEGADPDWVRLYMRALYDAEELARLDAFIRTLQSRGPLPGFALELDWRIGFRQGDLKRQVVALERLRQLDQSNADVLIHLADCYQRLGRDSDAQALVDLAEGQRDVLTAGQLVQLGAITARLGQNETAVRFVFEALRRDPADAGIHLAFLNSMLQLENDVNFDRSVVGEDTVVTLRGTKEFADDEYTYLILDRSDVDTRRNEYRPFDPVVADLIGLSVGAEVIRRKGQLSEQTLIVTEIHHVFVYTVRDVMSNFSRRFPESTALQQFKIGDTPKLRDVLPLVRSTAARSEQIEKAIGFHVRDLMPLGAIAAAVGSNEASLLEELTHSRSRRLNVERGGPTQLDASLRAARPDADAQDGGVVVLTRSGLFTAQEMQLLGLLRQSRSKLVVPRTLVEAIAEEIGELTRGRDTGLKYLTAASGGAGIRLVDRPAAEVREEIARRQELLEWLEENTHSMPRPVASLKSQREELRKVLGDAAFDAISLAADVGGVIYADDVGLRELATNDSGVGGFSTFALVTIAAERGLIGADKRDDVVLGLIQRNHYFVPLTAEFLERVLSRNGYEINAEVLEVLDRLADEHLILPFGISVVADLLRRLSTSPAGPSALRPVTLATLEALTRGRDVIDVAGQFETAVAQRMVLLPQRLADIQMAVQAFVQSRLVAQAWK
jgi:tetratricopeptide (TPR) repeat protein